MRERPTKLARLNVAVTLLTAASASHQKPSIVPAAFVMKINPERSLSTPLKMNFLSDLGDALSGGKLEPQTILPYSPPLAQPSPSTTATFAVKERATSFTGEDFDITNAETGDSFATVRGAMLHLPGKDKMTIRMDEREVAVLDRKIVAVTPTYDLYRGGDGEKIGWIEKTVVSFTASFDVYMQGGGGMMGPFKPPPAYRISGDFIERNFIMKNEKGQVVAKVSKDGFIQFDAFNHYQIQVAPGMDPILVIACTCAIDEEFDKEHKEQRTRTKKAQKGKNGGGWF